MLDCQAQDARETCLLPAALKAEWWKSHSMKSEKTCHDTLLLWYLVSEPNLLLECPNNPYQQGEYMKYSCFLALMGILCCVNLEAQGSKPLTVQDIMKFKSIVKDETVISPEGDWVGYIAKPDRGNSHAVLRSTRSETRHRLERGLHVLLPAGSRWAAVERGPDALDLEDLDKEQRSKLKTDAILINLTTAEQWLWEEAGSFAFSEEGSWFAVLQQPSPRVESDDEKDKESMEDTGTLLLRKLVSGHEIEIADVSRFSFSATYVAYAINTEDGVGNGLYYRHLAGDHSAQMALVIEDHAVFPKLAWNEAETHFAWMQGQHQEDEKKSKRAHSVNVWEGKNGQIHRVQPIPSGSYIPHFGPLRWSKDSQRLFLGTKLRQLERAEASGKPSNEADLFDVNSLLNKRKLDVWHGDDPLIKTHERKRWKNRKKHTYAAVWTPTSRKLVPLADLDVDELLSDENGQYQLLITDKPYRKRITWEGHFRDVYLVHLRTGKRTLVVADVNLGAKKKIHRSLSLSPEGRFVVYYNNGHYTLYTTRNRKQTNLTQSLGFPFVNENHDYPAPAPGYGIAGWLADDAGVLVYDKYDIWVLPTNTAPAYRLTGGDGRDRLVTYRLVKLDEDKRSYANGEKVLLSAFYEQTKHHAFYRAEIGADFVERRMEDQKKYRFLVKAKEADVLIYSREDYREFPDLWAADTHMNLPKRLTNENPQLGEFALGQPSLLEWKSTDGAAHQGVLYKPGNYVAGNRYPVLVYYYRIFSDRLYEFNEMVVNHRPNFAYYTSNGYAVFLPDIHFKVGTPGASATKSLVPGVQKLIDMGIADARAIGLHGHSWSGYQTAFVVTQTDLFRAAVAGAPVTNMTSAYGGIRLESGMARQFQYEQGQSRIGASLWERRDLYVENSPLFFADRINTPLLIQFGDKDNAVPWHQGVELYLAMRRLGKEVIFLQYRGEPHHLKQYPNKLDYTLKMKAFFDYHLKGKPAAEWISKGEPYHGD